MRENSSNRLKRDYNTSPHSEIAKWILYSPSIHGPAKCKLLRDLEEKQLNRLGPDAVSLGMLMSAVRFPDSSLPVWCNTAAKRMLDMGIPQKRVKEVIANMEKERRRKHREHGDSNSEFDEMFARYLNKLV